MAYCKLTLMLLFVEFGLGAFIFLGTVCEDTDVIVHSCFEKKIRMDPTGMFNQLRFPVVSFLSIT